MTAFVDSSALVKLYVPEPGYTDVRALSAALAISQLARVEVPAAFWRKYRIGELRAEDARLLTSAFEVAYSGGVHVAPRFGVVMVTTDLLDEAARLVAVHPLRAYDSVQLASAILARRASQSPMQFMSFDRALREAASAEGLPVVPV